MSTKQTEWKAVDLSKNILDFSGASSANLEQQNGNLLSLTFRLKDGKTVRIRKNDYSVTVEAPVIPMITQYTITTKDGLTKTLTDEREAKDLAEKLDAEISETHIPLEQPQLQNMNEVPF